MELSRRAGRAGFERPVPKSSCFFSRRCSRAKPGRLQRVLAAIGRMRVYLRPPLQPYLFLGQLKAKRLVQTCRARCLFGNDYQRMQVVISLSLTPGPKDQRSGNPTTPEVRMRFN